MNANPQWVFAGATPEGASFTLEGIEVWEHSWIDAGSQVHVEDPRYHQKHLFQVYKITHHGKTVLFAAGEFSNGIWGFYKESSTVRQ